MPLIRNRQSLGRLSHWKGPVSRPAVATASAIEIVMNTLFADGEENENALEATHFSWDLDVQFKDRGENKGNGPREQVRLSVKKIDGSKTWVADATEIEALLSLWLQHATDYENEKNEQNQACSKTDKDWLRQKPQKKNIRFLGPDTVALQRDLQWWLPSGALGLLQIQKGEKVTRRGDPTGTEPNHHVIDYHRITGFYKQDYLPDLCLAVSFQCTPIMPDSLEYISKETRKPQTPYRNDDELAFAERPTIQKRKLSLAKATWEAEAYLGETALGMVTVNDRDILFAQHVFTAFMSAVADKIDRIHGKSQAFQGAMNNRPTAWQLFRLENTVVSTLALAIQNAGLGTMEEALLCIIPPLSIAHRLPLGAAVDLVLRSMEEDENILNWERSAEVYEELLRFGYRFHSPSCLFTVRAAAASVECLKRMRNAAELYHENRQDSDAKLLFNAQKSLSDALEKLIRKNVKALLHTLYRRQKRAKEYRWFMRQKAGTPGTESTTARPQSLLPPDNSASEISSADSRRVSFGSPKAMRPESPSESETGHLPIGDQSSKDLGYSPLHNYVISGIRQYLPVLKAHKRYVSEGDIMGWTPLHYAVMHTNDAECTYVQ